MLFFAALCIAAPAQTLAHKNWEGSGISSEAWWRTAVFYRIEVASFQDSDGDGIGDLRGVAQRLDYLQSLGVDVLVLEPPFDEAGFDDLLREASRRHIRLAVAVSLRNARSTTEVISEARGWLTRGVAGLDVIPALDPSGTVASFDAETMRALRKLTDSFPGQRVLLAERVSGTALAAAPLNGSAAQLEDVEVNYIAPGSGSFAGSLRRALLHTQTDSPTGEPWLVSDDGYRSAPAYEYAGDNLRSLGTKKIIATMLFAAPGAIDLLFAQELGTDAIDLRATMQWTPSNVTRASAAAPQDTTPILPKPAPNENVYGAYKPYVAPPRPIAIKSLAPAFDADALPGFSSSASAAHPGGAARRNVAQEDRDPQSLLNFYRRLGQLHHGNATLRNGPMQVVDRDDSQALLWIRRAPSSSRTAGSVVIACNLGPKPVTLSVREEFERMHIHASILRPLLASWTDLPAATSADRIELPAYSVYIGEASVR